MEKKNEKLIRIMYDDKMQDYCLDIKDGSDSEWVTFYRTPCVFEDEKFPLGNAFVNANILTHIDIAIREGYRLVYD